MIIIIVRGENAFWASVGQVAMQKLQYPMQPLCQNHKINPLLGAWCEQHEGNLTVTARFQEVRVPGQNVELFL